LFHNTSAKHKELLGKSILWIEMLA
jgi:hypothetical protein